jgi:hypothetical protein
MEPVMSKPVKQQVRTCIQEQAKERKPPPSREEIRRQLGWNLIEAVRRERRNK